jgi:Holliday junction resolvase
MSHYRKGSDFERLVKHWLEGEGYFVVRSAGSHGPVDLVAIKGSSPTLLVQCKTAPPTGAEKVALDMFAKDFPGPGYWVGFATPIRGGEVAKFTTAGA